MALLTGDGLWSMVLFTVIFLLLVDLMHRRKFWTARYPPGPVPLPGLGNLLQVDFVNMPYSLHRVREMAVEGSRGHGAPAVHGGAEVTG